MKLYDVFAVAVMLAGIALQAVAWNPMSDLAGPAGLVVFAAGLALVCVGIYIGARANGRSTRWVLVGLIPVLGMFIGAHAVSGAKSTKERTN